MADATPEQTLAAEYDLGDTGLDLGPKRDPETGRFVKAPEPAAEATPASASSGVDATEPAPQAPAPPSPHPRWLVQQALDRGYEQEDIDATPTATLHRVIHREMQAELQHRQEVARFQSLDRPAPPPLPKAEAPADDDALGIDEEAYDPAFVKLLKEQRKEIKELKSKLTDAEKREQARAARTLEEQIDLAFESLGPEYERYFGTGPIADLAEPERKRRLAAFQTAAVDLKSVTPAKLKKQLREAADTLYPPAPQPATDPKKDAGAYAPPTNGKRITPEQWDRAATAPPTQRRGAPEPAGEHKAKQNLERKLQEAAGEEDVEITNGLLD